MSETTEIRRVGIVFPVTVFAVVVVAAVALSVALFSPGTSAFNVAEAVEAVPGSHTMSLLEAELAEKERSPERAIEGYLKAIKQGERPPQAIRRVVQLLNENGRTAEADRLVQDLIEQHP